MEEIYFEIKDSGNFVRIEPQKLTNSNSELNWDNNWVVSRFVIKGGSFSGGYHGEVMTIDFEKFKQELSKLYDELEGKAEFRDLEGYLKISISGDGIGHFETEIVACDNPGIYGSELRFSLQFDQTQINEIVSQLDRIVKEFPIKGDFKIKNE